MITRRDGDLYLVEQTEHARLAGDAAARWGNDRFAAPEPRESVVRAAAMHDEGWREADAEPLFGDGARRPRHFTEVTGEQHVPLYRRGVDAVMAADRYAGLLVSMHWTGLYRSRWGMGLGRVEPADSPLKEEAVEREERRWIEVKRELTETMSRTDLELSAWHNYELLQAWDLLSLYVCAGDLRPSSGAAPRAVVAGLASLDHDPGPRTLGAVPVGVGGERVELTLTPVEPGVVAVDPYPFDGDVVDWTARARVIPDRGYESAADAAAALATAREAAIGCRLTRA